MLRLLKTHLCNWRLNYEIAAFGAYCTILVEALCLILGGFEDASPLSISLLTSGSAVAIAGFGDYFSTPLAVFRISLTTAFLLISIVSRRGGENFDGTCASLCSVAHLFQTWIWQGGRCQVDASSMTPERARQTPSSSGWAMSFTKDPPVMVPELLGII